MPNQINKKFFGWFKAGNSGCIFARLFVLRKDEPWESVAIYGEAFDETLHKTLSWHLQDAIARNCEALQFVFPGLTKIDQIIHLIKILCKSPRWYAVEIIPKDGEVCSSLLVGLRWILPNDQKVNWVLGFADIETMPQTRRAPCTAIMLRIKGPGEAPGIAKSIPNENQTRTRDRGRTPVHLADMDPEMTHEAIKKSWNLTEQTVRALNGENKAAAHAKVTFALPSHYRAELRACLSVSKTVEEPS